MKKEERNEEMKNRVIKAMRKSFCAVMAGGLLLGGLNIAAGLNDFHAASVQAAVTDNLTLLTSENEGDEIKGYLDVSDLVEDAMPSVVSITTKSIQEVQNYYSMFGFYGYAPYTEREVEGSGSGIIVGKNDTELLIATNYHVVEGATTLSACFVDNKAYEGKVKGYDAAKDLAVVAVSLDDIGTDTLNQISIAKIGSSDDLKVGEQVVAIGNAMGYGQSVTTGIVSAKNRQLDDSGYANYDEEDGVNLIQTDAAINPGNSGGALLNMKGEVVGINSAKLASTTVEGMGYAIAISDVGDILETLMNTETREKVDGAHGVLGIKATTVSEEAHKVYRIPEGALIVEIEEDSAAQEAGLTENTIITKFNGRSVSSVESLVDMLEYYEPGEKVEITVAEQEGNGYKEKVYSVTLQKSAEDTQKTQKTDKTDDRDQQEEEDGYSLFGDWEDRQASEGRGFFGDGTFGDWH